MHTRFIQILLLLVVPIQIQAASSNERPNVLFIMTDDLNCNIGAYGHPLVQTPNIDRLAERGLLFENAFNNFPLCGPSRASFMTGLYPDQNGVTRLRRLFRNYVPDAVTMSQHFMNHGYVAARVGKIYHYDNPGGIGTNGHDDALSWNTRINPRGRDKEEQHLIHLIRGKSTDTIGGTLSWTTPATTNPSSSPSASTSRIRPMSPRKSILKCMIQLRLKFPASRKIISTPCPLPQCGP